MIDCIYKTYSFILVDMRIVFGEFSTQIQAIFSLKFINTTLFAQWCTHAWVKLINIHTRRLKTPSKD